MSNIINLVPRINEVKNREKFLGLLDKDIQHGNIKKVPENIFARIAAVRQKARSARERNELLEM